VEVVGESDWVAELEILMKRFVRICNLFCIAWVCAGLLVVSCNLIPGLGSKTSATLSPVVTGAIHLPLTPPPGEPVISLDLSTNQANKQVLTSLLWLQDGRFVLTGIAGISLYQLPKAGLQPQAAPAFKSQIVAENPTLLTSTPDGIDLAWISAERTVVYWNTAQSSAAANITASDSPVTGLALNPNKKDLAYSTLKGEILLWGSGSQSITQKWQQNAWLSDLSFSPDGQYLAGVDPSGLTATIFTQDGHVLKQLEWTDAVNPSLFGAFFSPDWKKLAWVSQSVVQFMDVTTGKTTVLLSHEDAVGAIAWAPDSLMFATSSTINQGGDIIAAVMVWDSNTGKLKHTYPQTSPVQSIAFAPDNQSLAVLDIAGQLHVWRLDQ
jgi:WD40 repeat protein